MKSTKQVAYSVKTLASMYDLNEVNIRKWISAEDLRAYKMGKEWRIDESDWEDYKSAHVNHRPVVIRRGRPRVLGI